jgi:ABC-type multidrug transport system ATPase subunit
MINVEKLGKQYNQQWLFRDFSFQFQPGNIYGILGPNGSGKSTFVKLLMGLSEATEGKIIYSINEKNILQNQLHKHYSFAAPYSGLLDDLTLKEQINIYARFKPLMNGISADDLLKKSNLSEQRNMKFHFLSSGMKQRLRLALAILSDTPFLFLDEPASHLDADSTQWFHQIFQENVFNRTIFIATNQHSDEICLCKESINIAEYKKESPT